MKHSYSYVYNNNNSVALVLERIIPTERPQLVDEVSANFRVISVTDRHCRILEFCTHEAECTPFQTHYLN
jgi:hypothetical protein